MPIRPFHRLCGCVLAACLVAALHQGAAHAAAPKKIVLIAGKKSHGPIGNGIHDYPWSVKLLKVMLDNSNVADRVRVECHLDGWPADEKTLNDADAIMIISDGRDGDLFKEAPQFSTPEHTRLLARQMRRGCGFLTFHFSTFAADKFAKEILDWTGGYFDWETDGKRLWYSAIATKDAQVVPASTPHPTLRGVKPFSIHEEFYYNIRFAADDPALVPLWTVAALGGRPEKGNVVAWARQRGDGGRGFGTTCGHFYDNWKNGDFRRTILNALVWAAKAEVPAGGVASRFYTRKEITEALAGVEGTTRAIADDAPIRVLLFAGNEAHKWHNWQKTTPAIKSALERDPRIRFEVSNHIEDLKRKPLGNYDVIVQNYANWNDPHDLSDESKKAFVDYLQRGGGLIVIHFANGAFHFSLPTAGASDWPEYRKIVRRVWNHHGDERTRSGHDAFGSFQVQITPLDDPITANLSPFTVTDELYFRQAGTDPIEPLLTARSKTTGRDEPLAWRYTYGRGRIFQTLLGHSEKTYDAFESREIIRRAAAWAAGRRIHALAKAADAAAHSPPAVKRASLIGRAKVEPFPHQPQAVTPPDGVNLAPVDHRLKATLIDRSATDSFTGIRVDSEGNLFVGGREAVFVFEPNTTGDYQPKREILHLPQDSIVIGLEFRGDDLYVLANNALYLVPEGRVRRTGRVARRILWGIPLDLHITFHCMAWGPEGDLYLNHGDPLLNYGDFGRADHWGHWTLFAGPKGEKFAYTGVGAILRIKPDGSQPHVIATGLRGPVGLVFDPNWNLFTNDNDHESIADRYAPARLLHVTPHIDFGWPRGWMASKSPDRADLIEPMLATLGRGVPCDLAYYDDEHLPADYRKSLLMCRWDRSAVYRYPLTQRGASFQTEEQPFLVGKNNVRPVGIAVGRGGRVFVTSLYLSGNVGSPYCPSDLVMIARADDAADHPYLRVNLATLDDSRLWSELSQSSWQRRHRAFVEVLRRGRADLAEAARRFITADPRAADFVPLMSLAAASGAPGDVERIVSFADAQSADLRLAAVRASSSSSDRMVQEILFRCLSDPDPRAQLAALGACFEIRRELPWKPIVTLASSDDTYLRQTATKLIAQRGTVATIRELIASREERTRLAGAIAAGFRLTIPPSDFVPPAELPLKYSSGNAFFALRFADSAEKINLQSLGRTGSFTTAECWNATTHDDEQNTLFRLLRESLDDSSAAVRSQAIYFLELVRDARVEPAIARARLRLLDEQLNKITPHAITSVWRIGPFEDTGIPIPHFQPPEQGALDLSSTYGSGSSLREWQVSHAVNDHFDFAARSVAGHAGTQYVYVQLSSGARQKVLFEIEGDEPLKVWHNGRVVLQQTGATATGKGASVVLDVQPGSTDLLACLTVNKRSSPVRLRFRAALPLAVNLPDKLDSAALRRRLSGAAANTGPTVPAAFVSVDWERELSKASVEQGRRLFGAAACNRCHAITAEQKGGGAPSLADAHKRFTVAHLIESVLLPSRQVAEPFRATTILKTDGKVVTGLVVGESGGEIELLLPDASRQLIPSSQIEERRRSELSPMPTGLVKTPTELRDLIGYLLSENPAPP
jgi:putative heme-binding domain-containing protein